MTVTDSITWTEVKKRKAIKKYFKGDKHILAWILIFGGLPLIAIGVGIIMIIAGIVLAARKTQSAQEVQVDAWSDEDFRSHNYVDRARELFNFSSYERSPVLVRGIAGQELSRDVFQSQRLGNDGKLRSTPIAATVILCGPDQMGVYQTGIDLTTGNCINETLWEVFYQDVTSIGTSSNSYTIDFKEIFKKFFGVRFFVGQLRLSEEQKKRGFTASNLKKAFTALEKRYKKCFIGDFLQREISKTYYIDLADGDKIRIIASDERPTREANRQNDAAMGNEVARSMQALREFVREKKRYLLH